MTRWQVVGLARPGMAHGRPVETEVAVPIEFKLP